MSIYYMDLTRPDLKSKELRKAVGDAERSTMNSLSVENDQNDVGVIQSLLSEIAKTFPTQCDHGRPYSVYPGRVDEDCGPKTIRAIDNIQRWFFPLFRRPDRSEWTDNQAHEGDPHRKYRVVRLPFYKQISCFTFENKNGAGLLLRRCSSKMERPVDGTLGLCRICCLGSKFDLRRISWQSNHRMSKRE